MTDSVDILGPIRTCIGCRTRKSKDSLVRLVVDPSGRVVWDSQQTMKGRGAYLCPSRECLNLAVKAKRFNRAFRGTVAGGGLESSALPWEKK